MATRFYLHATATPSVNPGYAGWSDTGGAVRRTMAITRQNSALTNFARAETSSTNNYNVLLAQFVSAPLTYDGTLSGTVHGVARALESSTAMNAYSQLVVKVVSGDGSTLRGTALTFVTTGGTEWPTTTAARRYLGLTANRALTSTAFQAGDRIVVEIGYSARNTGTTNYTGTLRFGDPTSGADMGDSQTGTADEIPWVEFSQDLILAGSPQSVTCNAATVGVVASDVSADPGTAPANLLTVRVLQNDSAIATRVIDVAALPTTFTDLSFSLTDVERALLQNVDSVPVSLELHATLPHAVEVDAVSLSVWPDAPTGPTNQTIGVNAAAVSANANAVTPIMGRISTTLDAASVTAVARDAASTARVIAALQHATVSISGNVVSITLGRIAATVDAASVAAVAHDATSAIGTTRVTTTTALVTATANTATPAPGRVGNALDVATVATAAQLASPVLGGVSVTTSVATVSASPQNPLAVTGRLGVALDTAAVTVVAQIGSTAAGRIAVTAHVASVSAEALDVGTVLSLLVQLAIAEVTATARAVTLTGVAPSFGYLDGMLTVLARTSGTLGVMLRHDADLSVMLRHDAVLSAIARHEAALHIVASESAALNTVSGEP